MPVDDSGRTMNANVAISPTVPTRASLSFKGWCAGTVTTTNGTDSCSGITYQPNSTYTLDQTSGSNNLSLTAMWQEPMTFNKAFTNSGKTQLNGYYKMQDANASICSVVDQDQTGTLIDTRDNQTYAVAKLADGKCWMVENLNLAGGTALSASDTDVTSAYISSFTTSNNLTKSGDTIVLPASSTSGFSTANYSYVYNSGNKTSNCASPGCYSYYSWDAATLGSGRTIATENTDAEQSICPKGWRLPTSGNSSDNGWKRGDFYALATAYGTNLETNNYENSATFYNNAGPGTIPNFLLAGRYYYGSFYDGGAYGYYWSSTSYSSTSYARYLRFYSSTVSSASDSNRSFGLGVRCLFSGQ